MSILKTAEILAGRAAFKLPLAVQRIMSGRAVIRNGRTLDAQVALALQLAKIKPATEDLAPIRARENTRSLAGLFDVNLPEIPRVENFSIPAGPKSRERIPLRLYAPRATTDLLPCVVYFHGGGFVIGDLESHDGVLRRLCAESGLIVVAVDYRLAPEYRYPVFIDDALAAYAHVVRHAAVLGIDARRIGVGGDSAGGNLAVQLCMRARKSKLSMPAFQVPIYPWLDLSMSFPSVEEYGDAFFLKKQTLEYFRNYALTDAEHEMADPGVSPIFAKQQSFKGLPPAFIPICGFDPLQDEGAAYHELLVKAGVASELKMYESLIHGALNLSGVVAAARPMMTDLAAALKRFTTKKPPAKKK